MTLFIKTHKKQMDHMLKLTHVPVSVCDFHTHCFTKGEMLDNAITRH